MGLKKDMPEIEALPAAEWEAKSVLHKKTPGGDESMAFSVRLPNDWEALNDGDFDASIIEGKIFTEVVHYVSPPDMLSSRSRFLVSVTELDFNLTAEQWFLKYLLEVNYKVEGFSTISNTQAEALYVKVYGDDSYAVRARVAINGKRVMLAEYYMPIEKWESNKAEQRSVISSLEFAQTSEAMVEEMKTYAFLDLAEVSYPVSWTLRSVPLRSLDHISARLLNLFVPDKDEKPVLNGRIDMDLISVFEARPMDEEIQSLKESIEKEGFVFGESLELPDDFSFGEGFKEKGLEVYELKRGSSDVAAYELWMTHMMGDDYYYFMRLLTPSRINDYDIWVRNTQTFKLISAHTKLISEERMVR